MENSNEIILVGTFHFVQHEEIIKEKEIEIEEYIDYLSKFKPTKIAVEWDKDKNEELNQVYGNWETPNEVNEVQQVGFRLARKLKHEELFSINTQGRLTQEDVVNLNEAIQKNYPDLLKRMNIMKKS